MNYLPLPPFEHKIFYTDNNIRFVRATIGDQVYQMTTRWELNRPAD